MLKSTVVPLAVCLAVGATAVIAHEGATGVVDERMGAMKSMASELKDLAGMFKAPDTFDHERAVESAQAVRWHAEGIPGLFPEGSAQSPSRASDAIWDEWDDFVSHAKDLQEAALEFGTAVETGAAPAELKPGFDAMADGCKTCHEDFRLPG